MNQLSEILDEKGHDVLRIEADASVEDLKSQGEAALPVLLEAMPMVPRPVWVVKGSIWLISGCRCGPVVGCGPEPAVVTQPDKPQGRSRSELVPPPVKVFAQAQGIPVLQPVRPVGDVFAASLRRLEADLGIVVAAASSYTERPVAAEVLP